MLDPLELPVELPALPVLPGERCGAVGAPGLLGLGALGLEGEADRSAGALPGAPLVRGLLP